MPWLPTLIVLAWLVCVFILLFFLTSGIRDEWARQQRVPWIDICFAMIFVLLGPFGMMALLLILRLYPEVDSFDSQERQEQ